MSTDVIAFTPGAGDNLWADSRTIAATVKKAQYVLIGDSNTPTFTAVAKGVITTTAAAHLIFIQADGTNYTRIKWIRVWQSTLSGAVNTVDLSLILTSTAGTGGTTITARGNDPTDSYTGIVMTLPTAKGTEGNTMGALQLPVVATNPMTGYCEWKADHNVKPIVLGTANTSGLCLKQINAVATNKVDIEIWFTSTPYL